MIPIVLDNVTSTVRDDMKKFLRRRCKISVAATRFSIYAYDALKKQLDGAADFRFIFTSPTFVEPLDDKAQREFLSLNSIASGVSTARNLSLNFATN